MPTPAGWPDVGLDVQAFREAGFPPTPLPQYVMKIASRCNLACDYCYVYEHADTSWRAASRFMSRATARRAARRMAEHARTHAIGRLRIVLHGGEPLLLGRERFTGLVAEIRAELAASAPAATAELTVQTNGTLLDEQWLDLFQTWEVRVGVSLDGDAATHDRHRRYPSGRPSRDRVERGVRLLAAPEWRHLFSGVLAVVDLNTGPAAFYDALTAFDPPRMDLLLPHATWESPPPAPPGAGPTPYADWLAAVFDRWYDSADPVPVRLFEALIDLLLGADAARSGGELLGLAPLGYAIIDTDGSYKQSDALNLAYDGCSATGLSVARNAVDELLDVPGIAARQLGRAGLAPVCLDCDVVEVCGGGHYGHRYRAGSGFRNASVYCSDMRALIAHVRTRVGADLQAVPAASDGPARC